jgi:hypothetical protein
MLRYILYALLIWFLYNLVFRVIIPVYRTTRQVKKRFNEMRQQMEENEQQPTFSQPQNTPKKRPDSAKPTGDYIDFEEVKGFKQRH